MARTVKKSKKVYWLAALLAVLLIVAGVAFENHRRLTSIKIPSTGPPAASKTAGSSQKSANSPATATGSGKGPETSTSTTPAAPAVLMAPSGNFVSNHSPGQNGAPTSEVSVCNTTPGASCYIQFTMGSTVKKLDAKTTDDTGSAIWYWDVGDAGFTQGSWQISAVASLNGQSKTAQDSTPLQVQP